MERDREIDYKAAIKLLGLKLTDQGKAARTGMCGVGKALG